MSSLVLRCQCTTSCTHNWELAYFYARTCSVAVGCYRRAAWEVLIGYALRRQHRPPDPHHHRRRAEVLRHPAGWLRWYRAYRPPALYRRDDRDDVPGSRRDSGDQRARRRAEGQGILAKGDGAALPPRAVREAPLRQAARRHR